MIIQTSKNTRALRVINGVCGNVTKGNCRRSKKALDVDEESQLLPKRRRKHFITLHEQLMYAYIIHWH